MIKPSDQVRLLGVTIAADLGLSRQACHKRLQDMFLLASSAETCSSFVGHCVCKGINLCHIAA